MSCSRLLLAAAAVAALAACSGAPASGAGSGGRAAASPSAPSSSASASPSPSGASPSSSPAPSSTSSSGAAPELGLTRLQVPGGLDSAPLDQPRQVTAPAGWRVSVWARVPGARLAAWAPDGVLLVSRPGAGEVVAVRAPRGSASGSSQRVLAQGLTQPHGLAFDGSTLYVAESDRIDAYTYASGALGGRRTVIDGLPDAKSTELGGRYAHALKSVAVGKDGWLYFSVGSTGNVSAEDRTARPERAAILRVRPSGGAAQVYARGVRNGTGLAVDPTGAVWTGVNNRDNIAYPYQRDYDGDGSPDRGRVLQSYVNDHPLELLARLTPGRDLGWPYCNPDPDVDPGAPGSALTYTRRPYLRDLQTNADGRRLDCASLPPVEQGMPAHSAPLGLTFVDVPSLPAPYRQGALVGIHGSWNRQPPRPPQVAFFPWRGGTLGPQQTLLSGFQLKDGSRWGRPVMALPGPDGAIYVTDDAAGAIYRMTPP